MTILSETRIVCDVCLDVHIHAKPDVDAFLADHGWQIEHWFEFDGTPVDQHTCPRCARGAS